MYTWKCGYQSIGSTELVWKSHKSTLFLLYFKCCRFWYQLNCRIAKTCTQNTGGVQLITLRLFLKSHFNFYILDFKLPYFTESNFPWKKEFQLCTGATKVPWICFGSSIPLSSLEVGHGQSVFLQLFQLSIRVLSDFPAADFWVDKLLIWGGQVKSDETLEVSKWLSWVQCSGSQAHTPSFSGRWTAISCLSNIQIFFWVEKKECKEASKADRESKFSCCIVSPLRGLHSRLLPKQIYLEMLLS